MSILWSRAASRSGLTHLRKLSVHICKARICIKPRYDKPVPPLIIPAKLNVPVGWGLEGHTGSRNLSLSDDDGDIETLVDFEDTFTTAPIKGILESVIVILTLVRVSLFSLPTAT